MLLILLHSVVSILWELVSSNVQLAELGICPGPNYFTQLPFARKEKPVIKMYIAPEQESQLCSF